MRELYKLEIKKLLLKENIIILLFIFILIGSVVQIKSISYPYQRLYEYNDIYNKKFSYLNGSLVKDIEDKLDETNQKINDNNKKTLDIIEMYKSEDIDLQQVKDFFKSKEDINVEIELIQEIKKQIDYLNSNNIKYYTDINGLTVLVDTGFDFSLFLFTTIVATIIYIRDKECQMDMIIKTTLSNILLIKIKKRLFIFFSSIILLSTEAIRFLFILSDVGFSDFFAQINTSPFIGNSEIKISFFTLYIIIILLKLLWIVIMSYFYYWLAQFIDNSLYFLTVSIVLIVIPYLIIPARTLAFIPVFGLLESVLFFKGSIYNADGNIIFKNYTLNEYLVILFIAIVTVMIILKKYMLTKGKIGIVLVIFLVISGCKFNDELNDLNKINYNISPNMHFEIGGSYIFDPINSTMVNLNNDYLTNLERNPFVEGNIIVGNYYENSYYYLNTYRDGFEIRKLNLDNFDSEEIYKEELSIKNNLFVDVIEFTNSNNLTIIDIPSTIFCCEEKLLLFYHNKICIVDIESGVKKNIIENNIISSIFSIDRGNLYYLDNVYQLHKYDLNTMSDRIILDKLIKSFSVINDKIYYIDLKDDKLYMVNENITELVIDEKVSYYYIENEICFMVFQKDSFGYSINLENKILNQITDYKVYSFNILENKIIYSFYDDNEKEIKINFKKIN